MTGALSLLSSWGFAPRRMVGPLAAMSALATLLESAAIAVVMALIHHALDGGDGTDLGLLGIEGPVWVAGAVAAATLAVAVALHVLVGRRIARLSGAFVDETRQRLLRAFRDAELTAQEVLGTARLQDLAGTTAYQASLLPMRVASAAAAATAAGVLFVTALAIHPIVGLVVIVTGGAVGAITRRVAHRTGRLAELHLESQNRYATSLAEWADLHRELRIIGVEPPAYTALAGRAERTADDLARLRSALEVNVVSYRGTAIGWLLALALLAALVDVPDPATALIALALIVRAVSYVQQTLGALQVVSEATPACAALLDACRNLEQRARRAPTIAVGRFDRLVATGLTYAHPATGTTILSDVDVRIGRGDRIGIVGATGAGKTTLLNLLTGLLVPTAGTVELNGSPVTDIDDESRRHLFGYAGQSSTLMEGTLRDNVALHREIDPARGDELLEALLGDLAGRAGIELGPRGVGVSGGQGQRLALVRALVNAPEVVILDEPTSALDAAAEARVMDTVGRLASDTTLLLITHRPEPLALCDRFYVVRDGGVVETDDAGRALALVAGSGR